MLTKMNPSLRVERSYRMWAFGDSVVEDAENFRLSWTHFPHPKSNAFRLCSPATAPKIACSLVLLLWRYWVLSQVQDVYVAIIIRKVRSRTTENKEKDFWKIAWKLFVQRENLTNKENRKRWFWVWIWFEKTKENWFVNYKRKDLG